MLVSWQTWPLLLNPVALTIGNFPVTWYAIMYIIGALMSGAYFVRLAQRQGLLPSVDVSIEVIVSVLWGVLIGARLGYVVLYGGPEFLAEPWRIFIPYDFGLGAWVGIRGMSFHGGLLGGALGLFMFTREAKRDFFRFSDVLVQAVPIALLCGRVGNFLNQEILGRMTTLPWGISLPQSNGLLLHPVTLYEAATEGALLFVILFFMGQRIRVPGRLSALFLFLYAGIRYAAEYFRATPAVESLVFGLFSVGQALSLVMVLLGLILLLLTRKRMV